MPTVERNPSMPIPVTVDARARGSIIVDTLLKKPAVVDVNTYVRPILDAKFEPL